jgi:alpha-galactosidase
MQRSRALISGIMSNAGDLPVSFVLDGRPIRGIPADWKPTVVRRRLDANMEEVVFEGEDPRTKLHLRFECTEYRDFPVVEWVAWFTNKGTVQTPIMQDIQSVCATLAGEAPVLWHCNGDFCDREGYAPTETPLKPGTSLTFAPNGGRSCDGAFPYYRIAFADGGLTLAIGWPGQWSAEFTGTENGVRICAGQEKTHLKLLPGESIRTPRITVLSWTGDATRAVNLWRRWYLAHVLPRPDGRPMRPLLACAGTDEGEEFTAATEENQIRYIDKFHERGIRPDVWWIDAGWYPCFDDKHERKWWHTGTWQPDPERFPRGMKPVSDRAAQLGADLLVWFEPERVQPGTRLDREHGEWLVRVEGKDDALLYLGNAECRQWLTDHICSLIRDNGIKIYRQDHNFPPLRYWRETEPADRQGMNENLHVQGYLRFWDDLLARNPGLWIDSCASGGRRNDLETMRRSVPLHYTDFGYGDHPVKLAFHHTLYQWIPYFKECTLSWDVGQPDRFDPCTDSFSFHCGMAAMLFATLDIRRDDYDFGTANKMIGVWRRASDLLLFGDFYPHTPFHTSGEGWVAWQFDDPATGRGFIQAIRLASCPDESITIHPAGISPDDSLLFENQETGESLTVDGDRLARDGYRIALPPRSGAIWFYQRAGRARP